MKKPSKMLLSTHQSLARAERARKASNYGYDDLVIEPKECLENGKKVYELRLMYRKHHSQINGVPRKELKDE